MKSWYRSLWAAAVIVSASAGMTGASWAQVVTTYSYDRQGQVVAVARSPTASAQGSTVAYAYDAAGNRTQLLVTYAKASAGTVSYNNAVTIVMTPSGVYTAVPVTSSPADSSTSTTKTTPADVPVGGDSTPDNATDAAASTSVP